MKYFNEIGIDLVGRFGRWAYLNMVRKLRTMLKKG